MTPSVLRIVASVAYVLILPAWAKAHDIRQHEVKFSCEVANLAGELTLPAHQHDREGDASTEKSACVVIVGGTLSHTRDGGLIREGVPPRDALKRLALHLANRGYASLRYDKVGFGDSKPSPKWQGTYRHESHAVTAAVAYVRELQEFDHVVVLGESAGAYLACLAAEDGLNADAYVFLGGHCGSGQDIYEYNFARLARLADTDAVWRSLAGEHLRFELALGRTYEAMFAAAARGDSEFMVVDGDFQRQVPLARRQEELQFPPDKMFRFIQKPALALSGEYDLNVPPDHGAKIVQAIRSAGNHSCTCVLIPQADHNFQISPDEETQRLRERYTFESFRRAYAPQLYEELGRWLDATLGYAASGTLPKKVKPESLPVRATDHSEQEPKTENTPARLHLAPGVQVVEDVADTAQTASVATLEGAIGPLLLGENCQSHFIDMPAGMYCEEHPHASESIIYTVRGTWVLCSKGRRKVMKPGSLFHFAPNTPTGYETPFDEDALILIFKGQRLTASEAEFMAYLRGLAQRLEQEHKAGVPYRLTDLPKDHPALQFAHEALRQAKGE